MKSSKRDAKPKTEGDKKKAPPAPKAVPDSPVKQEDTLPPLDPKAKGKPEDGNT